MKTTVSKPKRPKQPSRPRLSAYFIFSEEIRAKMGDTASVNHQQLRGIIQKRWNNLEPNVRKVFQDRVDQGIAQYDKQMEDYKAELERYQEQLKEWKADQDKVKSELTQKDPPSDPDVAARLERNREAQKKRRKRQAQDETEEQRSERLAKERDRVKRYRQDRAKFEKAMAEEDFSALPEEPAELTVEQEDAEIYEFDEDLVDVGMDGTCPWAGIGRSQLRDSNQETAKKVRQEVATAGNDDDQDDEEWDGEDLMNEDDDEGGEGEGEEDDAAATKVKADDEDIATAVDV
jgi:HMG (high mobility group) box